MITAKNAKELSKNNSSDAEIKSIEAAITKAAKEGKTDVWHYKQLSNGAKEILSKAGYKINEQFDRNEYLVNIKW